MGLNYSAARLLLLARSMGVSFDRSLTLGRQNLFVTARDLVTLLSEVGEQISLEEAEAIKRSGGGYCEGFFEHLGAKSVVSVDATDYEHATVIHDFNRPIPESMRLSFDLVYDGGTLEHVFDFPTAIRNCMEALKPGGHFVGSTPANNLMGHGFYQFSPELFYRIFTPENGFEVMSMYICENRSPYQFYAVADPKAVGSRVQLTNFRETYLLVVARRVEVRPIFASPPQQSDYATLWSAGSSCDSGPADPGDKPSIARRLLPNRLKHLIRPIYMMARDFPLLFPGYRMPGRFFRKIRRRGSLGDWP